MIAVRTQIKEIAKEEGIDNISADFFDRFDIKVKELAKACCKRAKENGRKTLMGKDV
ncbi:DUF1931 domain-containing protein [Candidatus Woesearchaeota archaeon]|jgi:histone H3/H4|nr:DUF1931 domain-containing protein [Candidatus Woesearchaeota archaeon]